MGLETMQDIGGIRVIMNSIEDVYKFYSSITKARFKHTLVQPPHDYIQSPKKDGYRSIHQVFKYSNKTHPELNVLHIELQIRTKLQHAWATAVETLGIIENASFKTGEGDEKFKQFFKLSSALFSMDEGTPVLNEYQNIQRSAIIQEIKSLEDDLQITRKLKGITLTAKQIETNSKSCKGYYLMKLDTSKNKIFIMSFSSEQLEDAEDMYKTQEKEHKNNKNISIVLIKAQSVKEIKKAYPNYFLDTNQFIEHLTRMMSS